MERKKLQEEQQKTLEKLQKKEKVMTTLTDVGIEKEVKTMEEEEDFKSPYIDTDVLRSLPKENKKFYKELYKVIEASDVKNV